MGFITHNTQLRYNKEALFFGQTNLNITKLNDQKEVWSFIQPCYQYRANIKNEKIIFDKIKKDCVQSFMFIRIKPFVSVFELELFSET